MAITRGGGNGGRGGGRDKVKPKRGGPRHFTVHPRDLYMKEGRPEGCPSDEEESDSQASQSGSEDELVAHVKVMEIGCSKGDDGSSEEDESSSEEEERAPAAKPKPRSTGPPPSNPNRQGGAPIPSSSDSKPPSIQELSKKPAHELTRREREAIEKERARQHFLKMKEKEDGARLAVIKKQREEAAAKAAAEKKAKEEARFRKRE